MNQEAIEGRPMVRVDTPPYRTLKYITDPRLKVEEPAKKKKVKS